MTSSTDEARALVRKIAAPAQIGDTIARQVQRASRRIPFMSYHRIKRAWYGDQRLRIDADEIEKLRKLAGARDVGETARDEFADLQRRIQRLEEALGLRPSQPGRPDDHSDS